MQALSTAELFCRGLDEPPVLFEESLGARKVVLNRPSRLNSITFEMASQMIRKLRIYEDDHTANLVILKGNGQAFCSGGDLISNMCFMLTGHWSFGAIAYKKLLTLTYLIASYKKPLVCLIDGIVMGSGAGISMYGSFRVVTDNTVFAMPEASIGLFPDVGASHFLSKLPGYFGEYVGLTGARLNGATMLACGLATHFVFSKDLPSLEHALSSVDSSNASEILSVIDKFAQKTNTKEEDFHKRLKSINKCFSRQTVEGILHSLEKELEDNLTEKWIADAVNNMKSASPTSLKIFLRSIREGRGQTIEQCLAREYTIHSNIIRRKITNDFYEGSRAMLFDKDKKPKWDPPKLELVRADRVDMVFKALEDDDDWNCLQLPARSFDLLDHTRSKL